MIVKFVGGQLEKPKGLPIEFHGNEIEIDFNGRKYSIQDDLRGQMLITKIKPSGLTIKPSGNSIYIK